MKKRYEKNPELEAAFATRKSMSSDMRSARAREHSHSRPLIISSTLSIPSLLYMPLLFPYFFFFALPFSLSIPSRLKVPPLFKSPSSAIPTSPLTPPVTQADYDKAKELLKRTSKDLFDESLAFIEDFKVHKLAKNIIRQSVHEFTSRKFQRQRFALYVRDTVRDVDKMERKRLIEKAVLEWSKPSIRSRLTRILPVARGEAAKAGKELVVGEDGIEEGVKEGVMEGGEGGVKGGARAKEELEEGVGSGDVDADMMDVDGALEHGDMEGARVAEDDVGLDGGAQVNSVMEAGGEE